MSERTPTLAEIGSALRVRMAETVGDAAVIIPAERGRRPRCRGNSGAAHGKSRKGKSRGAWRQVGLSVMNGVYSINLSLPQGKSGTRQ